MGWERRSVQMPELLSPLLNGKLDATVAAFWQIERDWVWQINATGNRKANHNPTSRFARPELVRSSLGT
jgi:hypothetical protein